MYWKHKPSTQKLNNKLFNQVFVTWISLLILEAGLFFSTYNTAMLSLKLASLNGLLNLIIYINAVFDSKKQRFVYNREMVFQNNAALLSSYNHLVFFIVPPPKKKERKTASHFTPW